MKKFKGNYFVAANKKKAVVLGSNILTQLKRLVQKSEGPLPEEVLLAAPASFAVRRSKIFEAAFDIFARGSVCLCESKCAETGL